MLLDDFSDLWGERRLETLQELIFLLVDRRRLFSWDGRIGVIEECLLLELLRCRLLTADIVAHWIWLFRKIKVRFFIFQSK